MKHYEELVRYLIIEGRDSAIQNIDCYLVKDVGHYFEKLSDGDLSQVKSFIKRHCEIITEISYMISTGILESFLFMFYQKKELKIMLDGHLIEVSENPEKVLCSEKGWIKEYGDMRYINTNNEMRFSNVYKSNDYSEQDIHSKIELAFKEQGEYANESLLLFGYLLIRMVRDAVINKMDIFLQKSKRFNDIPKALVPIIVDDALDSFLFAIEQLDERMKIFVRDENILESSDGLCGELYTEAGWIALFSKERYYEV